MQDLGITKKDSSNWQRMATVPDEVFEAHVEEVQKRGEPLAESRIFQFSHKEGGDFSLLLTHAAPEWPKRMIAVFN